MKVARTAIVRRDLVCGMHDEHDPRCTWCVDQVCRTHDEHSGEACPGCGWVRTPMPAWVQEGVVFGLNGRAWRVVSSGGSTNRYHFHAMHFANVATVEPVEAPGWELPPAPCPRETISGALKTLFGLPTFRADELGGAIRRLAL